MTVFSCYAQMINLAREQISHFIIEVCIMLSIGWSIKAHTGIPIPSVPLVMQENSTVLRNAQAVILQPNATGTCLVS